MVAPAGDDGVVGKDDRPPSPKKPYSAPSLTVHGRIEEITAAAGATHSDGVLGSQIV